MTFTDRDEQLQLQQQRQTSRRSVKIVCDSFVWYVSDWKFADESQGVL